MGNRRSILSWTLLLSLSMLCTSCSLFPRGKAKKLNFDIEHGGLTVNPFIGYTQLKGIRVMNPLGFDDRVMVLFPEIYVNYDERGLSEGGVMHFSKMEVEVAEVLIVRNKKGTFNFEPILDRISPPSGQKKKSTFKVDHLHLKIDRIVYKDYSAGSAKKPLIVTLDGHFNRTYKDVTDTGELISSAGNTLLDTIEIRAIANYDLLSIAAIVGSAWEGLSEVTKSRLFGGGPGQEKKVREKSRKAYEKAEKKGIRPESE